MNKLNSFDENKKKCFSCKEYFEKPSIIGIFKEWLCLTCLKESHVDVRQFVNKHVSSLNQSDSDQFVTFMEYCEIQKKLMDDFKNEQT